ncbi:OsmC family protein [Crocinitomix catalasitica]|uniref:OsmC family protein n=1 Tax=Crocinitomix catalasitica TaxID=184607 RepID=UPI000480514E|nr:OsmC family protein [Crocinitomix catalasitica]
MGKTINVKYVGKDSSSIHTSLNEATLKIYNIDHSPIDLLISSYASSLMETVDCEARKQGFESTVTKCEISYEMSDDDSRINSCSIFLFFEEDFDVKKENILETASKTKCPVGKNLSSDIKKSFRFFYKTMSKACFHK